MKWSVWSKLTKEQKRAFWRVVKIIAEARVERGARFEPSK